MGEKKKDFKAHFDWLIEDRTARRILAGEFGVGDRVPDTEAQRLKQEQVLREEKTQLAKLYKDAIELKLEVAGIVPEIEKIITFSPEHLEQFQQFMVIFNSIDPDTACLSEYEVGCKILLSQISELKLLKEQAENLMQLLQASLFEPWYENLDINETKVPPIVKNIKQLFLRRGSLFFLPVAA